MAFIRAADLDGGRVLFESASRINPRARQRITKGIGAPGDVLLSHKGTVGKIALVPGDAPPFVCSPQTTFWRTLDRNRLDRRFLYSFLRSPGFHEQLATRAGETDMAPYVSLTSQRGLSVSLPPIETQRAIGGTLGVLDDKIDLNRRMSETLEAIARALFKSWFVDFDPVRAKAEGRDPGLPKTIADLFPDSFEESELGEIPRGWRVEALGDCVDAERGLSYKGSGLRRSGMPMHNLNSIYEGGGYKDAGIKNYDGQYKPRHLARAGDVLVVNTEQGHDRLLIGHAAIVPASFDGGSLFSHHLYRVRPKRGCALTTDYLCRLLNTSSVHDTVSGYANGTTVNMLPMHALQMPSVVIPLKALVGAFTALAQNSRQQHECMIQESRTLVALRDGLLPGLVSGRLLGQP
ncbi:MAG: restriction endonuclease subunit S [Gemmatimonadales bacterium]